MQVVETFARDCFVGHDALCSDPTRYRFCLADEHYVSTLLAVGVLSLRQFQMHVVFFLDGIGSLCRRYISELLQANQKQ